ncbi:MAG: T9SS type A sorting domain-containing protein [Flavobacteriaceae bacterium]|nr:T9SS type A sorting domain-containing protein [Flavobacteriaceae bacterium]
MGKKYFWATALFVCLATLGAKAQFTDDFNWIELGECPPWWGSWTGECITVGNSGCIPPYGGYLRPSDPGAGDVIDPVLDLGNKTSGEWGLKFCMYVPSNREAYFNLQGQVPVGGGEWIVGNIFFNQDANGTNDGIGLIDNSALGAIPFNFPHDEWFDVEMHFDLTGGMANATWEFMVNETEVLPAGTPFTDSNGTVATSLGGVNFFSLSNNSELFIDYIEYTNETPSPTVDGYWEQMDYDTPLATGEWWDYGPIAVDDTYTQDVFSSSGYMYPDGSSTSVLNFGNQIFGLHYSNFYMYIPSGKEAAFSLQGKIPLIEDGSIVGDILFNEGGTNPGQGKVMDSALGEVSFSFPHDQWFRVDFDWDISIGIESSVWGFSIDGVDVIPMGTDFTNNNGDYPESLGGMRFEVPSIESEYWIDNILFSDLIFGLEDVSNPTFSLTPNPAQREVRITTEASFEKVHIYNLEGKLVHQSGSETLLDVSALQSGIYFVEITNGFSKQVQKLIKQ